MSDEHATKTLRLLGETLIALAEAQQSATHTVTITETLSVSATWTRARLWEVPEATRLEADDLATALGITKGALYKTLKREAIPHRKRRDGSLVFLAGDVRRYFEDNERVVVPVSRPQRVK